MHMSTFVLSNKSFGPIVSEHLLQVSDKESLQRTSQATQLNHFKEDFFLLNQKQSLLSC